MPVKLRERLYDRESACRGHDIAYKSLDYTSRGRLSAHRGRAELISNVQVQVRLL